MTHSGRPGPPAPASVHCAEAGLAVLACGLAYAYPVELFVAAFVLLGPLHYWTEIAWLDARGYFLPRRREAALLVGLALVAAGPALGVEGLLRRVFPGGARPELLEAAAVAAVVVAAGGALLFPLVLGAGLRLAALAALALASAAVSASDASYVWFVAWAVLLPTLVHVFPFTIAFSLHGALRERSVPALLPVVTLLGGAAVLLAAGAGGPRHVVPASFLARYAEALGPVVTHLAALLPPSWVTGGTAATDGAGLVLARLSALAYTTHYVNWFVKTTVIGWHRLTPARLAGAGAGAALSLALVAVDARAGLAALAVLSLLHVFLELPLDWRSFAGIGRGSSALLERRPPSG